MCCSTGRKCLYSDNVLLQWLDAVMITLLPCVIFTSSLLRNFIDLRKQATVLNGACGTVCNVHSRIL